MARWIGLNLRSGAASWLAGALLVAFALSAHAAAAPPAVGGDPLLQPADVAGQAGSPASAHPSAPPRSGPVQQATYQSAASPSTSGEPMPIGGTGRDHSAGGSAAAGSGRRDGPATPSAMPALTSMFGSLAIVLGLFFGLAWLMRRGMPKGTRLVSSEVVEVLGRSPLAGRQQMQVIRFGNRLLLVAVSPGGAETLGEITEPAEVDRLAGICQQSHANSATASFRQLFRQIAEQPASRGLGRRRGGRISDSDSQEPAPQSAGEDDVV